MNSSMTLGDLPGGSHAIPEGHFDAQQDQIVFCTVGPDDLVAVREGADVQRQVILTLVAPQILDDLELLQALIFDDCDPRADSSPQETVPINNFVICLLHGAPLGAREENRLRERRCRYIEAPYSASKRSLLVWQASTALPSSFRTSEMNSR